MNASFGAIFKHCENLTFSLHIGCPLQMLRKDVNAHLPHCPASVIMCTAEWNRWPLFTWKRRKNIPFRQVNPLGVSDQLDIALTLRDQRMLDSLKCIKSRKTRLSLRNNLTRRYPAVPLPGRIELKEDQDFKLELGLMDPFSDGTEGVDKDPQAEAQLKQWEEDFDCRLKTKNYQKIPKYWEFPELEKGNIHKHCSSCFDLNCLKKEFKEGACSIIPCRWKCGAFFHSCKSSEHKLICPKYEEEDEFEWMLRGVTNLDIRMKKKSSRSGGSGGGEKLKPLDDLFKGGPGEPASRKIQKILPNGKGKIPVPPPHPPDNLLKPGTGLDVTIETVTRLQTKPHQMYTFVCGQEFRRDEYAWHCKVIHDQVIGGLNNWVEHRCPLSSLGCGFSHRRLFPSASGSSSENTLIFSPDVESFGITNNNIAAKEKSAAADSSNSKSLLDLPLELLLDIVASLDSFSISNLALVSVYLRQVCSILLDTRGLVTLQWQRRRRCKVDKTSTTQWEVSHKRWKFSTSLGPVESWRFSKDADGAVSEHLKECPYNVKTKHVDAKKLDKNWPVVMQSLREKLSKRLQLR